jgi:hypothetical protein
MHLTTLTRHLDGDVTECYFRVTVQRFNGILLRDELFDGTSRIR